MSASPIHSTFFFLSKFSPNIKWSVTWTINWALTSDFLTRRASVTSNWAMPGCFVLQKHVMASKVKLTSNKTTVVCFKHCAAARVKLQRRKIILRGKNWCKKFGPQRKLNHFHSEAFFQLFVCFWYFFRTPAVKFVSGALSFSPSLSLSPLPRNGELLTQRLKSHLVRTQSLNALPLNSGVGPYIAIHTTLTARDFFLAYSTLPVHSPAFFQNLSRFFSCVGCG